MKNNKKELFTDLSNVEPQEVEWLWKPLIPFGMITIMEGDPGIGKSYLAMHLAAQISIGGKLPGGQKLGKGRVLYLSAEDDPAYTIRPRIDAMGGNPKRIRIQDDFLSLDDAGLEALMCEVRKNPPDLVIIDPLFAYMPAGKDMYRPNVIRQLLSFLKEIAEKGETAILIVRHLTKGKHDKAIYQGGGSIDVIGAARSAFWIAQHPDDEKIRLLVHIKHNIAKRGTSWTYELVAKNEGDHAILKWRGASEISVDELMQNSSGNGISRVETAVEFLRKFLKDGPKPSKEVELEARAIGIKTRTLDRARKDLRVVSNKTSKGWCLSLPEEKRV